MKKNRVIALIGLMCLQAGSMNAMDSYNREQEELIKQTKLNKELYDELISEKGDPKRVTSLIESGADTLSKTGNGNETIFDVAQNLNNPALLRAYVTAVRPKQLYFGPKGERSRDKVVQDRLYHATLLMKEGKLPTLSENELRAEIEKSYERVKAAQAK